MSFSNYCIQKGDKIIFRFKKHSAGCKCCKEEIHSGKVLTIYSESQNFFVSFLRGFSQIDEIVNIENILGVGDPSKTGTIVEVGPFRGYIILSDEERILQNKDELKSKLSKI